MPERPKLARFRLGLGLLGALFHAQYSTAQSPVGNSNPWYEIEVSIFSQQGARANDTEMLPPDSVTLEYPDHLTLLQSPREALLFDFSAQSPGEEKQAPAPPYSPATRSFHLPGNQGAYVPLNGASDSFSQYNQRLQNASQYRLLWHGRWRQRLANTAQSVAIAAGDRFGDHHQLEGWLSFGRNGNLINLEADLWLGHFELIAETTPRSTFNYLSGEIIKPADEGEQHESEEAPQYWTIPPSPIALPKIRETEPVGETALSTSFAPFLTQKQSWQAVHVDVLREVRPMSSNKLNYLDHPALGVLVEVRPYEGETSEDIATETDGGNNIQ